MTHICVVNLIIIGSDNGLSPDRRQAIILTNAGILLIGTLGTNFSEILIEIHTFSFKKMRFKMLATKWRPFCLSLNELSDLIIVWIHQLSSSITMNIALLYGLLKSFLRILMSKKSAPLFKKSPLAGQLI